MKVIWIQHTELACLLNIMSTERQLYTPVAVSTSHWKYSLFNVPSLIKLQLNSFQLILLLHSSHWVQSSDIAIKGWQKLAKCLNIIPILTPWLHGRTAAFESFIKYFIKRKQREVRDTAGAQELHQSSRHLSWTWKYGSGGVTSLIVPELNSTFPALLLSLHKWIKMWSFRGYISGWLTGSHMKWLLWWEVVIHKHLWGFFFLQTNVKSITKV